MQDGSFVEKRFIQIVNDKRLRFSSVWIEKIEEIYLGIFNYLNVNLKRRCELEY